MAAGCDFQIVPLQPDSFAFVGRFCAGLSAIWLSHADCSKVYCATLGEIVL